MLLPHYARFWDQSAQASRLLSHSWQLTLIEPIVDIRGIFEELRIWVFEDLIDGHKHRMLVFEELIDGHKFPFMQQYIFPIFDLTNRAALPVSFATREAYM